MPRHAANAATLVLLLAAALIPGAAVSRARATDCLVLVPERTEELVAGYETIAIATVSAVTDEQAELAPEAFLKGAVSAGMLVVRRDSPDECQAEFASGERVLVLLNGSAWPNYAEVIRLRGGNAYPPNNGATVPEDRLIDDIRAVTEQYAVPAQSESETQGIEWWKTIVPVGGAVLGIFIVGMFLMRIWHRIDPS